MKSSRDYRAQDEAIRNKQNQIYILYTRAASMYSFHSRLRLRPVITMTSPQKFKCATALCKFCEY